MRRLAFGLLVLAFLVGGSRLLAAVNYRSDEPTAVLALKRGLAVWIERPEAQDEPVAGHVVLDEEEPDLAYGWLYLPLMWMAPALAPGLAGVAMLSLVVANRQRSRRRSQIGGRGAS